MNAPLHVSGPSILLGPGEDLIAYTAGISAVRACHPSAATSACVALQHERPHEARRDTPQYHPECGKTPVQQQ